MARRGGRGRGEKVIDELRWQGFQGGALALGAGSAAVNLAGASTFPETIMRTRGQLVAWMDAGAQPAAGIDVAVGMVVVPDGTGTTVLWSPITDANAPWFFYSRFVIGYEEMVTDVVDVPGLSLYRELIDSKAMRRGRADTEIQLVVEQATLVAADAINVEVSGRFLLGR